MNDRRLLRAIARYAGFNARRSLGVLEESDFSTEQIGKALVLADPARPRSPMANRVLGWGAEDADQLDALLAHYEALGCRPHFDLGTEALVPELILELSSRDFEPTEALTYLTAKPGSQEIPGVEVERWGHSRVDAFRELLATSGATCEDEVWERRRGLYATDVFRVFVASLEGRPVAWATSFVDGKAGTCYLANAYTEPGSRGQGCQTALLAARLADAHRLDLGIALTDVVPGSGSQRNAERLGFRPAFTLTRWEVSGE